MLLVNCSIVVYCFFFNQKTAYEMRISDWSSDVCSSDLSSVEDPAVGEGAEGGEHDHQPDHEGEVADPVDHEGLFRRRWWRRAGVPEADQQVGAQPDRKSVVEGKSV